jgi:hypothetical protein
MINGRVVPTKVAIAGQTRSWTLPRRTFTNELFAGARSTIAAIEARFQVINALKAG